MDHVVPCKVCGEGVPDYLGDHLLEEHGVPLQEYQVRFPEAPFVSERLHLRYKERSNPPRRNPPPDPSDLYIEIRGIPFKLHTEVPESACLPMPEQYRVPEVGDLGRDVQHTIVALHKKRSTYIWGPSGSGKDALIHYVSAATRTPALIRAIKPGTDIQSWFYTRSFNRDGTCWEEGELLRALRDGYPVRKDGVVTHRIPYIILISDFDRADTSQAEYLRMITDTLQNRVEGPAGVTYPVLPGTVIVATANTAGSGDEHGRFVSANVIDATILNRFNRKFQFHLISWDDECPVVKRKFPKLLGYCPDIFDLSGKITTVIRAAIHQGDLYAEFSHRDLCGILEHSQDLVECGAPVHNLMKLAIRVWLDGLGDSTTRDEACKILDPHIPGGILPKGDRKTRTLSDLV